jgi:hypothetical protein
VKHSADTILRTLTAQPGFAIVEVLVDGSGRPVDSITSHIVAWAFEHDLLIPHPVTLCGIQSGPVHILQPDGSVERPNVDSYASVSEWLAAQQRDYDARLEHAK